MLPRDLAAGKAGKGLLSQEVRILTPLGPKFPNQGDTCVSWLQTGFSPVLDTH